MIRIHKLKGAVPKSLTYPIPKPSTGYTIAKNAAIKREELIALYEYIDSDAYNKYYKNNDTITTLKIFYNHKCCYCEQRVESYHVEHYRPKSLYWWLAYSWDNLLLICPACNTAKLNKFKILYSKANYSPLDLPNIHSLRDIYDVIENPCLLNPECDDLDKMWVFNTKGEIFSDNYRGKYTIETCKLNRDYLNDERKAVLDNFKEKAEELYVEYSEVNAEMLQDRIYELVEDFEKATNRERIEFIAFRRYAVRFINDIIVSIFS